MRILVVLAGVLALLAASPAAAGPVLDRAGEALRSDPVYVAEEAEPTISPAEATRLRSAIADASAGPVYVAVLPAEARLEAGGDAVAVLRELARLVDREGTYAVVAGGQFRAASTTLPRGVAAELAEDAFRAHRSEGVAATLVGFVDRVGAYARGEGRGGGGGGVGLGGLLPLLLAGGGALLLFRMLRRRRAARPGPDFALVKRAAEEDLDALGSDIRDLDLDVELPSATPAAKEAYGRALQGYERARDGLRLARTPEDIELVTAALEEGRYAMATAQALLEGREPPQRRAPCFFDPRHGPSDREVEWAPPGGTPRLVPACEADAQRVERGLDPPARDVDVGGHRVPYWEAPGSFGPYAGGYFGGLSGAILPWILTGSILGGSLGFPDDAHGGGGDGFADIDWGDFAGVGGGGDFGGGGGGGGDF